MLQFKNRKTSILIATDIVSRGIDIDDIQMVINYDVPKDPEDYVHRIGRTARANREGQAYTLVTPKDYYHLRRIEELIEREIEKPELPEGCGEKPNVAPPHSHKGRNRGHGKGKDKRRNGRKTQGSSSTTERRQEDGKKNQKRRYKHNKAAKGQRKEQNKDKE